MNIRDIDLNLLVILEALLRFNSVTRAAESLDMGQPAVSTALGKLRKMFNDPLFIRASRGLKPTPRAEQLVLPLQATLEQIKTSLLEPVVFNPLTTQRTFTFNLVDVGELVFLSKIQERMEIVAPNANIRTVTTPPSQHCEAMASGEVDLSIGYFPELQGSTIYQQRLFSHSFVCLVRKSHPKIKREITLEQFLNAKHIVVNREGVSHEIFEKALLEQGLSRRVILNVPHFLAVPLLVAQSDLLVTVPYAVGKCFAELAELEILRPPIEVPSVDVKQFWHARFQHDPANIWIRGLIASLFTTSPILQT